MGAGLLSIAGFAGVASAADLLVKALWAGRDRQKADRGGDVHLTEHLRIGRRSAGKQESRTAI